MSTSVVPIFDPQGKLRDVPQEQMVAAVKSGGMPSVRFQAPDGKTRFVPANRIQDAVKAGGKILPLEQQDVQHPGFWSTLIDDAKGLGKSLLNAGPEMGTGDQIHQDAEYLQKLKNEGRSFPYRALMSLTPNGMRESAESGDVGGVVGHTVVPAAAVASPLAAEGASRIAGSAGNAAKGAVNAARPAASSALRGVADVVSPDVTGIISPRLAHAQRLAGKLADAISVPDKFTNPGAPLPETPPTEVLQASSLSRGPKPVVDPAQGLGSIPVSKGSLQQAAAELGTKTPMPTIRARALEIQQQLNKSLGAQELKPNVPLRDQLTAKPPAAPKLPEGFTPVDSSALKGFKYDPATKEFETITQGGQRYIHGDVSPEAVQAFMDAESKGKAWQGIRNDGTLVAKVINGKRVAIKPTSTASAAPEDVNSPGMTPGKQQTPAGAFETGKPATIKYARNTEGAAQYAPGGKYNEVVPGRYMVERPDGYKPPDARWQTGSVEFRKPLVVDYADGAWKAKLSAQYGGKTGNALSSALRNDGYDGIITQDKYGTSEIVDLSGDLTAELTASVKKALADKAKR